MSSLSMKLGSDRGRLLVLLCRLSVAGVFLWAGVPKLLDPATFVQDITNYRLLPEQLIGAAALIIPLMELVIAAALVSGISARGAALVGGLMLLGFTAGMLSAMSRGIDLSCGCFGATTEAQVGWGNVGRNIALCIACAVVVVAPETPWRTPQAAETPIVPP